MKYLFLLATVLLQGTITAQHLNKFGHFINTGNEYAPYKINSSLNDRQIEIDGLLLQGNSVFKTPTGFVTLSGEYENSPSVLRIFSKKGKETFKGTFTQTINFKMSPSGNFCAFHDLSRINTVDLKSKKVMTYEGSNVFALNDYNQLAWYDDNDNTIHFCNRVIAVNEPVYRILFFRDQLLFVTRNNVSLLKNRMHQVVFTAPEGRIFDIESINNKLFISTKKEVPGKFIFNSFSSYDLNVFEACEETQLELSSLKSDILNDQGREYKMSILTNETIFNPIDYFTDTVYQAVGNSYAEIQEYTIGFPYPHPGVDLLGTYLQDVRSVKKGYVKAVLTTSAQYHWRIAISNLNTTGLSQGYLYAHLEEATIPYLAGDSVNESDVIGLLVDFPVQGFVHCHFARILDSGAVWNGSWWTFDNPLSYMTNFFDSIPPEFEKTINNEAFAFRDANGNYLSPDSLYGNVKVISKVFDRINSGWHVDVNKLRYSVSPLASPQTMLLDSFAYEYDFFIDSYFGGPYYTGLINTIYSRDVNCYSTADYSIRDFYHIVTNSDGNDTIDGNDSLQFFNTLSLPDSSYIFRVTATDPSGNATTDSMVIQIKNMNVGFNNFLLASNPKVFPNPSENGIFKIYNNNRIPLKYEVYTANGKKITPSTFSTDNVINLSEYKSGVYYVSLADKTKTHYIKLIKF